MKTDSQWPPFLIRCLKCNKEPGDSCATWEGVPVACTDRIIATTCLDCDIMLYESEGRLKNYTDGSFHVCATGGTADTPVLETGS